MRADEITDARLAAILAAGEYLDRIAAWRSAPAWARVLRWAGVEVTTSRHAWGVRRKYRGG